MITLGNKKGFLYRNRYILLAFFVPALLLFGAFAGADFFPFGQNQAAVIDMYHQYYPFIDELHEKLQNGGSLLYSWNGGLGTNFLALLSYYAASPLYFFTIFVPDAYLMEAVTVIILIKIGLAGAFMAVCLRGMHGKNDWSIVAFSCLYALCSYTMGYYWCLMWLDIVAVLPLCMLGLNRLLDRGDFKLYTISLAAMMITNYYIGGMVCIFILFYYPVLYFSRSVKRGAGGCLRITGKAILCSVTGIFIAGITLLPTFLNLQNTYYIDSEMPADSVFYNPLFDILTNLLPDAELTVREGLPNIYCGLISVMLFFCFLFCRRISARKKILNCAMLAFLLLSLNWNKLDFLWHGLHFPNQLPYRYSFVVSFLLVSLAYEAYLHLRETSFKQLAGIAAGIAVYMLLAEKLSSDKLKPEFIYAGLFLLLVYTAFLCVYRTGKQKEALMGFLLLMIVCAEMMNQTAIAVENVSFTNRAEYFSESEEIRSLVQSTRKKDPGFYRMEVADPLILNAPMLYHYPGVSQFSSTVNGDVSYFMEHIGMEGENVKNRYNYVMTTPAANAMFNVKYIIGKGRPLEDSGGLSLAGGKETTTLYENRYDLSLGYMVPSQVMDSWDLDQENPFCVLNDFVKLASETDRDIFRSFAAPQIRGKGVVSGAYEQGKIRCSSAEQEQAGSVQLTFRSPKEQQVYVYVETAGAETITAARQQGEPVQLKEDCGAAVSLGRCKAGEKVTLDIEYEDGQAGEITAWVYGLDEAAWEHAYQILDEETLQVTQHDDTCISGKISVREDGWMVTSIPYEKGWTAEVDGKEAELSSWHNAFLAVPLEAGEHEIRFSYMPEGLIPGMLLSLCGIGILAALCFVKGKGTQQGEEPAEYLSEPEERKKQKRGLKKRRFL